MRKFFLALFAALLAVTASVVMAATVPPLTLTNLKGPIAKAAGKPVAKSIAELWAQINGLAVRADAPAPAPAPTPVPAFIPTPAVTTSLDGLAPIASGLDVAPLLRAAWGTGAIPGPEDPSQGAFRFLCAPGQLSYDDPILYPGQPGKSHLHQWFGNLLANANSTYASLRTTGDSTCNNALNRSAYWIPAMMNGHGKVVVPDVFSVYYKRAPKDHAYCAPPYAKACVALPRGLRYVFGYNMQDPAKSDPAGYRWFNCPEGVPGQFRTMAEALKGCPAGKQLEAVVVAAMCWNGRDLDSPDHRSHMAYQFYNGYQAAPVCPTTHPYIIPQFQLAAFYTLDATAPDWFFSSDRMAGMPDQPPGTTFHADWFGAWEDKVQDAWTANCIDKALSCTGGDLGEGHQMTPLHGYEQVRGRVPVDPPVR